MKMKRYVILVVILILFSSSLYSEQIGIITKNRVVVRRSPNLQSDVIEVVDRGCRVIITDKTKKRYKIGNTAEYWYKIELYEGDDGWIFGQFVSQKQEEIEASQLFSKAMDLFHKNKWVEAAAKFEMVISSYPNSYVIEMVWYFLAESKRQIGLNVDRAKKYEIYIDSHSNEYIWFDPLGVYGYKKDIYEYIIKKYPKSRYADNAKFRLVEKFRKKGEKIEDALNEVKDWEQFLKDYPNSECLQDVLYNIADVYEYLILSYKVSEFSNNKTKKIYKQLTKEYYDKLNKLYEDLSKEHFILKYDEKLENYLKNAKKYRNNN